MFSNIESKLNRLPRFAWMVILYLLGLFLYATANLLLHGLISLLM